LYGTYHTDHQKGWEMAESALEISREMDGEFALPYAVHAGLLLDRQADRATYATLPVPMPDSTALTWFQRAVALNLPSIKSNLGLGHAALAVGDAEGALFALRKFVEFYPQHVQAHNLLALALEAQGQIDAALQTIAKAWNLAQPQQHLQVTRTILLNRARMLCKYVSDTALY
jgi:tetratricopeptide (TPR) repeat protein